MTYKEKNLDQPKNYISDLCSGSKYKYWKQTVIKDDFDLCLLWNVDGTPLAKSSKSQVWLIQAQIANIPIEKRRGFQFVAGIFYSDVKSHVCDHFSDLSWKP